MCPGEWSAEENLLPRQLSPRRSCLTFCALLISQWSISQDFLGHDVLAFRIERPRDKKQSTLGAPRLPDSPLKRTRKSNGSQSLHAAGSEGVGDALHTRTVPTGPVTVTQVCDNEDASEGQCLVSRGWDSSDTW